MSALDHLLADLKAGAVRQSLKKQLIRGKEWVRGDDGVLRQVETLGVLVGHQYVPLSPQQIAELKEEV